MNIAVFSSHNGSGLGAIIDACKSGELTASVCTVISNNEDSFALERAKSAGISSYHLSEKTCRSEQDLNEKIFNIHPALLPKNTVAKECTA